MEQIAKNGSASHSGIYKPRSLGNTPLAKLPTYIQIVTLDENQPTICELSQKDAFEYFYGIPYDSVYKKDKTK